MSLTKRQKDTLDYIKKTIAKHGYPPTVREIAKKLNVSSPATIHAHLEKLETKGYIKKLDAKNRAIELKVDNEFVEKDEQTTTIPLLGTVTAGNPIEAIEQPENFFTIPTTFINPNKQFFALKVSGDSMINAGIYEDDIVIIEQSNSIKDGDIVVAMTDDAEVTLKRFFKEKDYARLEPENEKYAPIILKIGKILGKAISLYRKL